MKIKNILKSKNFWLYLLTMVLGTAVLVLPVVFNVFNIRDHIIYYCIGMFIPTVADLFYSKADFYLESEKRRFRDDSV